MHFDSELYKKEGMYLHFPDGTIMDLSRDHIIAESDKFWNDPERLPHYIRADEHFRTCTVCPFHGQDVFCAAMKPLLPFLERMEAFLSYDKIDVVYVNKDRVLFVPGTTMQNALQYVTNMALFDYCEDVKAYQRYFRGIDPFMNYKDAGCRLFLNIYWLEQGDRERVEKVIKGMQEAITITSKSCVKRLNLICKSDAFMNAYVLTQTFVSVLSMNMDNLLKKYFDEPLK